MSVANFKELAAHLGHTVEIANYSDNKRLVANVALECIDCSEVLFDFDNPSIKYINDKPIKKKKQKRKNKKKTEKKKRKRNK